MATLMPCDGGFLSVRVKPSSRFFAVARSLYADLVALEQQIEGHDPRRRKESIEASRIFLQQRLTDAGYADYTAFMREAILAEVRSRRHILDSQSAAASANSFKDCNTSMHTILDSCFALDVFLARLVGKLDQYGDLNEQLADKARFVSDLAADVGLFSMNALIAATHMQGLGITLRAVAGLIQTQSATSNPVFQGLTDDVAAAVDELAGMFFPIAVTTLLAEMMMSFVRELIDAKQGLLPTSSDLGALAQCLVGGVEQLDGSLNGLAARLRGLGQQVASLKADLKIMRALELQGRIETARVTQAGAVEALFRTMAGQIETASREMDDLLRRSTFSFAEELAGAQVSHQHVQAIRQHVAALAAI
jgi:hypothetical protein